MSDIPSELYHEILIRVPAESLLVSRGVCKWWRQLIDDPVFVRSHINHQQLSSSLGHLLIRKEKGGKLLSFCLDNLDFDYVGTQSIDATHVKNLYRPRVPRISNHLPVSSCDGLILLTHHDHVNNNWVLWNPLTHDFHFLPEICNDPSRGTTGFGYDCINDDYKVVRFSGFYGHFSEYSNMVYSLKSDTWKYIQHCDFGQPWGDGPGAYLDGALYWMSLYCIIAFNLSTEEYRKIQLPDVFGDGRRGCSRVLNASGGCLFLTSVHTIKCLDVWVMKYDVTGNVSWTKLFSFDDFDVVHVSSYLRRLVTYADSYGHALIWQDCNLLWLDTDKNRGKNIQIDGINDRFSCQFWKPSLFRLENNVAAAGGCAVDENITTVQTKRKKTKAKKRVKVKFNITITAAVVS